MSTQMLNISKIRSKVALDCLKQSSKTESVCSIPSRKNRYLSTSSNFNYEKKVPTPRLTESYQHYACTNPLRGITLGKLLQETCEKFPDREALVFCDGNHRRTFSQFMEEVDKLAAGLLQIGIEKGDRVGIWGPNTMEWTITQFATSRIGAVLVNVNPAYQSHEMEYALKLVGCKALVASATFKTQNYYDMLRTVAPEIENCEPGHLSSKVLPDLKTVIMISDDHYHGTLKFHDLLAAGGPREVAMVHNMQNKFQFDDAINIQFTSGTTGRPKGATLSHHNIINNARIIGDRMGYTEMDRICCQVPLYHCFGMVAGNMCMATHGSTVVFPTTGYDPEATIKSTIEENCTTIYGTPTMYVDCTTVAENMKFNAPNLTKGVMAGSPCPGELVNRTNEVLGVTVQVSGCFCKKVNLKLNGGDYCLQTEFTIPPLAAKICLVVSAKWCVREICVQPGLPPIYFRKLCNYKLYRLANPEQ